LFFSPLINPFLPDFGDFSLTDYKDTTVWKMTNRQFFE
jgi:hypothetical protein